MRGGVNMENTASEVKARNIFGDVQELKGVLNKIRDIVKEPSPEQNMKNPGSSHKLENLRQEIMECIDVAHQIKDSLSILK